MGMTIDEIIQGIQIIKAQAEWDYPLDWQIVLDGAIEIMSKYQQLQADYENRLKADLVAMLEEIDLQFDEICFCRKSEWKTVPEIKAEYKAVIRQKIDALKEKIT